MQNDFKESIAVRIKLRKPKMRVSIAITYFCIANIVNELLLKD